VDFRAVLERLRRDGVSGSASPARVRGGEIIRRAARLTPKFRGRDFFLWTLASALNPRWPRDFPYQDYRGLRFKLDLADPAYRAIYLLNRYESDLVWVLEHLLKPGDTFVEAGTSIGLYTVIAGHRVGPTGRVIGFEPLDSARAIALGHSRANDLTNIEIIPCALSSAAGSAQIFSFSGLPTGHASLANLAPNGAGQTCELRTLDSVLATRERHDVRVVKLDVEGSEFAALLGAEQIIEASHPRFIVESNPETTAAFDYDFSEVVEWFIRKDYRAFGWHNGRWAPVSPGGLGAKPRNILFIWNDDVDALAKVVPHSIGDGRQ
jgi:FkbM family methyltransferase